MFNPDQIKQIQGIIISQLNNFNTPPVATHQHNGWDANNLDPTIALTGFSVYQVADASVAPTDQSDNGKFRFQVDNKGGVAHYYFWVYLIYLDQNVTGHTGTGNQIDAWKSIQLI